MQKRSSPHSKASGKKRSSAGRDHNRNADLGGVHFGADTCVGLYEARRAEFLWSSSMRFALAASTSRRMRAMIRRRAAVYSHEECRLAFDRLLMAEQSIFQTRNLLLVLSMKPRAMDAVPCLCAVPLRP